MAEPTEPKTKDQSLGPETEAIRKKLEQDIELSMKSIDEMIGEFKRTVMDQGYHDKCSANELLMISRACETVQGRIKETLDKERTAHQAVMSAE